MNSLYIVCALMAVGTANAFIFGGSTDEAWNDLKVTWGINPFGSAYQSLPRTMNDAIAKGWTKDRDCTQGGSGHRFVLKGDRAVMLIFGANGNIAGISAGIPKNLPLNYPGEPIKKFFDDEGDFLSITAYFTDPTTVCSTGPSTKLATGDRLIFKSKTFQVEVAREESKVDSSFWTLGKCFYTMGITKFSSI
jgi:charged multivesicular body protein 7